MNRRNFLTAATAAVAHAAIAPTSAGAAVKPIRAVVFDGLALFDPRPVFSLVSTFFPESSASLTTIWQDKLFEYTWLRSITGTYVDFTHVADDALLFVAETAKISVTEDQRRRLATAFLNLKAWPDVAPALKALKLRGIRLAPLNDFTTAMLESSIRNSGFEGVFDHLLSTDLVTVYKPDPRAYQMGVDAFKLDRTQIAFTAFAGWDAAGAKSFGYPTIWVNRLAAPTVRLAAQPDAIVSNFDGLLKFVTQT